MLLFKTRHLLTEVFTATCAIDYKIDKIDIVFE